MRVATFFLGVAACCAIITAQPGTRNKPPAKLPPEPTTDEKYAVMQGMEFKKDQESWPWVVKIGRLLGGRFQMICVGTILNKDTILTVSSCLGHITHVRVGSSNFFVKNEIQHPEFNPVPLDNDIGIIKLSSSIEFNNSIGPACLPDAYKNKDLSLLLADNEPTFLWWEKSEQDYVLRQATVPVMTHRKCKEDWQNVDLDEGVVCAGHGERTECIGCGDGGGPMMSMVLGKAWSVVGVISAGKGNQYPEIYTRVDHYLNWIRNLM